MTTNGSDEPTEAGDVSRSRWVDEAQEALDRTVDAVRSAWDTTREDRTTALESAKAAARELAKVLDKGIAAARERWAAGGDDEDVTPGPQ